MSDVNDAAGAQAAAPAIRCFNGISSVAAEAGQRHIVHARLQRRCERQLLRRIHQQRLLGLRQSRQATVVGNGDQSAWPNAVRRRDRPTLRRARPTVQPDNITLRSARRARIEGWATARLVPSVRAATLHDAARNLKGSHRRRLGGAVPGEDPVAPEAASRAVSKTDVRRSTESCDAGRARLRHPAGAYVLSSSTMLAVRWYRLYIAPSISREATDRISHSSLTAASTAHDHGRTDCARSGRQDPPQRSCCGASRLRTSSVAFRPTRKLARITRASSMALT